MSMESGWNDAVQSFRRLGRSGKAAVLLGAAAIIVLLFALWSFGKTLFVPSAKRAEDSAKVQASAQKYAAAFDLYVKQIDGRSLFVVPAAPSTPAPIVDEEPVDEGPRVDPKPTRYGGPGLIGMMSDIAWFEGGRRLSVGGPADGDSRLIALKAPWAAVVEWKGVEFEVPLFTRDAVIIASSGEKKEASNTEIKPETNGDKPADSIPPPETPAPPIPAPSPETAPGTTPESPTDPTKPESPTIPTGEPSTNPPATEPKDTTP